MISQLVDNKATKFQRYTRVFEVQGREDVGVFNSFSIVCERIVCCAGTSLAELMDTMFKMYWVFQMHYPLPPDLQVFMKFLQSVYTIVYANERMPNRVSELRNIQQLQQKQFVWKALPFVEVAWIPYVLRNLAW